MGARIQERGHLATVNGIPALRHAAVMASDLRASAALVLAALGANGISEVLRIYHLDRGYEDMAGKLRSLGARVARVSDALSDPDRLRRALDADLPPAASA